MTNTFSTMMSMFAPAMGVLDDISKEQRIYEAEKSEKKFLKGEMKGQNNCRRSKATHEDRRIIKNKKAVRKANKKKRKQR